MHWKDGERHGSEAPQLPHSLLLGPSSHALPKRTHTCATCDAPRVHVRAVQAYKALLEAGIDFIDTAEVRTGAPVVASGRLAAFPVCGVLLLTCHCSLSLAASTRQLCCALLCPPPPIRRSMALATRELAVGAVLSACLAEKTSARLACTARQPGQNSGAHLCWGGLSC